MIKLLIIVSALLAVTYAAPTEKRRVPIFEILKRRDPFPEPKGDWPEVPPEIQNNVRLHEITQRVDNFDPFNTDTYQQRYFSNDYNFMDGRPIFLFLAGEWEITDYRMTTSLMYEMAIDLNANLLYLEHRYYGQSRPTPNVTDENLRFLTPEQALADTAHFVNFIRTTVPGSQNSPFILVGSHYSASLAVWFRKRYPHLSIGVWASSAPLLSIVDFDQFKVGTGLAYRTVGGDICYDNLELGFNRIQEAIDEGQWDILTETFFICDPLEPEDVPVFFFLLAEIYALLPQFEFEEFIAATCDHIVESEASIESIAYILNNFIDIEGGECVMVDHEAIIEADRQTDWDAPTVALGLRQWSYKACTQLGWFATSGSSDQPFGDTFPVDFFTDSCEAVFGDIFSVARLNRNSDRFNTLYGGLNPEVSNVIFTHGQHDPWNVLGRRTNLSDDATAIVIQGATMSNDLGPRSPDNWEALRNTKNEIEAIINGWVDEWFGTSQRSN